jgi:hypothetical protein
MWSPRLYVPLLAAIKAQFLATAQHYEALGQFGQKYANLLTYAALEASETFTKKEMANATFTLPLEGLARCAQSLVQALDSSGKNRVEYWENRIRPYLRDVWPKSIDVVTSSVANSFVRLCMKAGDAFPDVVSELRHWLSASRQGDVTLHEFRTTNLAGQFPEASLTFLDSVIVEDSFLLANDLNACLAAIHASRPDLGHDPRFERLTRYARQRGGA